MEKKYRITNYSDELLQCMYQLQKKGHLCDTLLNCKDGSILIHSLVLLSCGCQNITNYLSVEDSQYSLKLQDFTVKTVCCFVQTIYTGEIQLIPDTISEFRKLCSVLGLEKAAVAVRAMEEQDNENKEPECSADIDLVINEKTGLMEKRVSPEPCQPHKKQKIEHSPADTSMITESEELTDSNDISFDSIVNQSVVCKESSKPVHGSDETSLSKACNTENKKSEENEHDEKVKSQSAPADCPAEELKDEVMTEDLPKKQEEGGKTKRKTATSTPKQRKYQQDIQTAIDAVVSGKLTIREACREYSIPDSTLRDRVKKKNIPKQKVGQAATFNKPQSEKLANLYCLLSKLGYNYPAESLCILASQYAISLDKRTHSKPITKHWFYVFCDGFPEVKENRVKLQQMEKTGSNTVEAFTPDFLSYLSLTMTKYELIEKPKNVYSFTTTELSYLPPYIVRKVPLVKETVNLFFCANAAGEVMPPYYVFPEASTDVDGLAEDCESGKAVLVEEKRFPSELFLNFLKIHFQDHSSVDEQRIILVDGHSMYVSVEVLEWAEENKISLVVIPSPCNEKFQPLEHECRDSFEKMFIEYCEANEESELDRKSLCQAVSMSYSSVFTSYDIKSSFRESGIYPLRS